MTPNLAVFAREAKTASLSQSGKNDEVLRAEARELRAMTLQNMSANSSAQPTLSEEFFNVDYLAASQDILIGARSDFPSLRNADDTGFIFLDESGRKFILMSHFRTIEERQFFVAAQIAHFHLHVAAGLISSAKESNGLYFPKKGIDPACFREASIFAYALLVPQKLESTLLDQIQKSPDIRMLPAFRKVAYDTLMPVNILERHVLRLSQSFGVQPLVLP